MATNNADFKVKKGLIVTEDIELGHATDTTIARASAGQITVEGTAVVLAGSANHDGFSDFVANEHIDHSGVSISAGSGLTGGGTIAANRTLTVGAGNGITVNTNDVAVTAAQTTITSVLNASLVTGRDAHNQIKFSTDDQIIFRVGNADGVTFKASGEIEATKFDGALEGNADTASVANRVVVVANNAGGSFVNENNLILFSPDGASSNDGGNLTPESSTAFHYNPSTTVLTVPKITSNLTGNASGSAGTVTTIGNLTGDVTSSNRATTIANNAVTLAKMAGLARGKIIYGDSNGDPAALALGSNGQVLTSNGTDISWGSAGGGGDSWGDVVDAHIIPGADDTYDLGSSTAEFRNAYFDGQVITDGLRVSGTSYNTLLSSANGSASYPTYTFEVDENTGMYRGGTDILGFSTAGTERMTISASGVVNIAGSLTVGGSAVGGASDLNGLTDVISNITNFTDSMLISTDNAAPPHGTLSSANDNLGIGKDALKTLTSGTKNVVIGNYAGDALTTSRELVLIGYNAGSSITGSKHETVVIGSNALCEAADPSNTVAIGQSAGQYAEGIQNVMVGVSAGKYWQNTGLNSQKNVFIGSSAGNRGTVNGEQTWVTVIGADAGSRTAIGSFSTIIGGGAGLWSPGQSNTFLGQYAGQGNANVTTSSNGNVAIGKQALYGHQMTSSGNNVAIGPSTLYNTTTGSLNIALGNSALNDVTSGDNNIGIGYGAGDLITTADKNITIGYDAGNNITTGSNNVIIGGADAPSATGSDQLSISSGDGGVTWIEGNSDGVVLGALTPLFFERAGLDTSAVDFRVPTVQSSSANPNSYPMPFAGTVKAMTALFTGNIASSSTSNVIRIRKNNGSSGSDIKDVTFTPAQFTQPASGNGGTASSLVKTGSDVALTFSAGDILQVKRQSGSTDLNNAQVLLWVSYNF